MNLQILSKNLKITREKQYYHIYLTVVNKFDKRRVLHFDRIAIPIERKKRQKLNKY